MFTEILPSSYLQRCCVVAIVTLQKMLEVPQEGVVLATDGQKDDAGLPHRVLVVGHVHHVGERLCRQLGVATADHHVEAAAEQAYGQALGEVPRAQDGHRGPHGQAGRPGLSHADSVLDAVGQEAGLGVVVVVVGGGAREEHWTPTATHHGDRVHPSLCGFFGLRRN